MCLKVICATWTQVALECRCPRWTSMKPLKLKMTYPQPSVTSYLVATSMVPWGYPTGVKIWANRVFCLVVLRNTYCSWRFLIETWNAQWFFVLPWTFFANRLGVFPFGYLCETHHCLLSQLMQRSTTTKCLVCTTGLIWRQQREDQNNQEPTYKSHLDMDKVRFLGLVCILNLMGSTFPCEWFSSWLIMLFPWHPCPKLHSELRLGGCL